LVCPGAVADRPCVAVGPDVGNVVGDVVGDVVADRLAPAALGVDVGVGVGVATSGVAGGAGDETCPPDAETPAGTLGALARPERAGRVATGAGDRRAFRCALDPAASGQGSRSPGADPPSRPMAMIST
jgi:hypothetical protein